MKVKRAQKGFGIVEVLIASMILVTVVGAVVALGSASVRGGLNAADKTVAYNLVQECLETVRGERNTAWTDGVANEWTAGMINPSDDKVLAVLKESEGCKSKIGEEGIGTPKVSFTRELEIASVPWYTAAVPFQNSNPGKIIKKVTVKVTWTSEYGEKSIQGSTYLSDWKPI